MTFGENKSANRAGTWCGLDTTGMIQTSHLSASYVTMTNDTPDDFKDQWNDLDEKVIHAQILTELQQIRLLLSDAERGAQSDAADETAYRCRKCDATMPAGDRERHARSQHKAPADMVGGLFTEVEG